MSSAAIKNRETDLRIAQPERASDVGSEHQTISEVVLTSRLNSGVRDELSTRVGMRQALCTLLILVSDVLAIAGSLELAIFFRTHFFIRAHSSPVVWPIAFRHHFDLAWLWLVLVAFLGIEGLYTRRRSLWDEVGQLMKAVVLGLVTILAAVGLTNLSPEVSRPTILLTALNLLLLLPIERFLAKSCLGKLGLWRKRILILGATETSRLAMRGLASDVVLGYDVVGVLDDDPMKRGKTAGRFGSKTIFVLGTLAEIREQMELTNTKDVLIGMPNLPESRLLTLVHGLQRLCENIYVIPQLWALPMMNLQVGGFLGERVMMLKLSNNLAKPWNACLKMFFDVVLGAVLAVLVAPLILLLCLIIKFDSSGPAFFVQHRLGYRGRNFRFLKLRTMHTDGEQTLRRYLDNNPEAADEWQKYAKLRSYDPRVTRIGRFLRRWSLDELPQLFNVVTGSMSLVGPRPYLPAERDRIGSEVATILSARPGITGLWQVNGRNQLTIEERVQLESWYVRNWTVWLDCIILAKTFRAVLVPEAGNERTDAAEARFNAMLRVEPRLVQLREDKGVAQTE